VIGHLSRRLSVEHRPASSCGDQLKAGTVTAAGIWSKSNAAEENVSTQNPLSLRLPPEYERRRDAEHLNLLSIFHFVVGAFCLVAVPFLVVHFLFFHFVVMNPEMWKGKQDPPPAEFFQIVIVFYILFGVMFVTAAAVNLLSGLFLRRQTHRVFSLVVAGLDCMQVPFGTVLGVFTIVVLMRDSVRRWYESNADQSALPAQ
jgi:hypothetical protein